MAEGISEAAEGVLSGWLCKQQEWRYFRTELLNEVTKLMDNGDVFEISKAEFSSRLLKNSSSQASMETQHSEL